MTNNKRYCVFGFGWKGFGSLENALVDENATYFSKFRDAKMEYERLWRDELQSDEGAFIYDTKQKRMIVCDELY